MFGYFPARKNEMIWTCLSHDVVAHETAHALLDGLRQRYTDPSSPDQAAFHEGFADVVALLSVFALPEVVGALIDRNWPKRKKDQISRNALTEENLKKSALFGLAEQMGQELSGVRGGALRASVRLKPSPRLLSSPEFQEPHRRGEIFVAAMLNAFIEVWGRRLASLGGPGTKDLDRSRVVEEGAAIADYLLTMAIRAIDYAPSVDLQFGDYLSAILSSDLEINPNDGKYAFRDTLRRCFHAFGVDPASTELEGIWKGLDEEPVYDRTHFESMQRDPDEVFRFLWENRKLLRLHEGAYSRVLSVRPCVRVGPDGFVLRETVAEYIQMLDLKARELKTLGITIPAGMPDDQDVRVYGGGALIFNEYGRLKYHVRNRLHDPPRQTARLAYLWGAGYFRKGEAAFRNFATMHQRRALLSTGAALEEW